MRPTLIVRYGLLWNSLFVLCFALMFLLVALNLWMGRADIIRGANFPFSDFIAASPMNMRVGAICVAIAWIPLTKDYFMRAIDRRIQLRLTAECLHFIRNGIEHSLEFRAIFNVVRLKKRFPAEIRILLRGNSPILNEDGKEATWFEIPAEHLSISADRLVKEIRARVADLSPISGVIPGR